MYVVRWERRGHFLKNWNFLRNNKTTEKVTRMSLQWHKSSPSTASLLRSFVEAEILQSLLGHQWFVTILSNIAPCVKSVVLSLARCAERTYCRICRYKAFLVKTLPSRSESKYYLNPEDSGSIFLKKRQYPPT